MRVSKKIITNRNHRKSITNRTFKRRLPPAIPEEKFEWKEAGKVGIVFWCKECGEIVKPEGRVGAMKCPKCTGKKIVFGTKKSIQNWTARKQKERN